MIVKVDLDPQDLWRLADEAEKAGMRLPDYMRSLLVLKSRSVPVPTTPRQRQIIELHAEGWSDVEIAARVDCVREYVVQVRRRHGLSPNRKRVLVGERSA